VLGYDLTPAYAQSKELKIARTTETRSTCPYCSVSCGIIIHTIGDKPKNVTPQVVHVEGDPDDLINRGTLCPRGSSLMQDILNERRLLKPQVAVLVPIIGKTSVRTSAHGQPLRGYRIYGRLHRHQRVQFSRG
jgi:anaerobic selenocysteine-containing dehydrogenase